MQYKLLQNILSTTQQNIMAQSKIAITSDLVSVFNPWTFMTYNINRAIKAENYDSTKWGKNHENDQTY
jgi:hypothetical protein